MADATITLPATPRRLHLAGWRKGVLLLILAAVWEGYARHLDNALLLPTFSATVAALVQGFASGELVARTATSLQLLVTGYACGLVAAAALTAFAALSRWGAELLELLTAMLNPLPAVALLPIALLWFGIGAPSLVFVITHAVLWPVALASYAGFRAMPRTLRMAGRNLGLSPLRFVAEILIPAALPQILAGLRLGWAFAWRTLIAAELVFGVSARSGGIGWFIYTNRAQLETANVFAGLLTIILVGLIVETLLFRSAARATVQRWGQEQ
ncbi:ABC transporter permease [Nitrospirillum amazonense]|uniref:NitT/TauT family transport system permease protein n=1 Tax=Nitrospirillum amazonense TaxID=28077 RepID=A0A560K3C7_9PROT|nr:ABC transporter permease [Nitrospirillum amazonense]MDG3444233.1 ABC transporter permease [Nitrospirillum amazonense]TWB77787.1 NitT/TauT family transport system permease protein [Nitrospirillum amazonense]